MPLTVTHVITRLVQTESHNTTVYGIADGNRVYAAHGRGAPADRRWDMFGYLARPVEVGEPLVIAVDDMVAITSNVVEDVLVTVPLAV